ncbi:teichoic acid D-Ala incorporation-associated protein DltX [Weissella diestrammenae]|uniref:Teichoic acid D-Ala incorporation-associated protein DltX n=1 Tax=Weissella diestrammenae TaxID=1162633 RepID=A0A7G9T7I6_9LACO|nr:teichoic acid D-Ala incorporation-associated protein DltX [Weissella diestrammenae]MCM0582977.1 teichoic acid D-Ala incorporation-associated protein DltX [Weissella diestrammenae]QNN76061.1 teichoic acid D-Ala incorporation-associated protein DltX [Weissella diestrammenae]
MQTLPEKNTWPFIKFILQSIFYFVILLGLLYLFGYSGHGQGGFIYNEF